MALHPWEKVEVDGGPVGTEVFWHCPVCGAGGGPVIGDRRMRPFLPGHGVRVSEDCAEAQKQARAVGETMIGELRARWRNPRGEHYHYASLFHDALRWNPQVTNVTALLDLLREVDSPTVLRGHKRPSIVACRRELESAGFSMSGDALGAAVRELGQELLGQMREGALEDDDPV